MFRKKKKIMQSKVFLVVTVVIAAFLAAFVGQIVVNNFTNIPSLTSDEPFVIRDQSNQKDSLKKSLASVRKGETDGFIEIYSLNQFPVKQSEGIILTNDGWAVSVASESGSISDWAQIRLDSGELILIDQIVPDPASDLVFLHLPSQNLAPVNLSRGFNADVFDDFLAVRYRGGAILTEYLRFDVNESIYQNTDEISHFLHFTRGNRGDLIYNDQAELIAIISEINSREEALAISVTEIRKVLEMLLRHQEISRPSLGISYVDLAQYPFNQDLLNGAWFTNIVSSPQIPVVKQNSAAVEAGLLLGDVIASVDGKPLNDITNLSDVILENDPGDIIELGIIRRDKPLSIKVELNENISK